MLNALHDGLSLTESAALHRRSVKTISTHKRNMMRKLGAVSDAELFQLPPERVVQADQRIRA
ncbi:DNA-binding transcriptional activator BglJ [compost metagenome]